VIANRGIENGRLNLMQLDRPVECYRGRVEVEAVVETSALRAAYEAHYRALVRLSVLLADDPSVAEDIVQDVFVRAASRLTEIEQDRWRAYLRAAVVNAWRNERRWARTRNRVLTERPSRAGGRFREASSVLEKASLRQPRGSLRKRQG
jgi:DNA-directed RNA polymerase specialized sigma24 family protein